MSLFTAYRGYNETNKNPVTQQKEDFINWESIGSFPTYEQAFNNLGSPEFRAKVLTKIVEIPDAQPKETPLLHIMPIETSPFIPTQNIQTTPSEVISPSINPLFLLGMAYLVIK